MELLKSAGLFFLGILKRIYWLLPTIFLEPIDLVGRLRGVNLNLPQWLNWALFILCWLIAITLTYHELRKQKLILEKKAKPKLSVVAYEWSSNRGLSGGTWWLKVINEGIDNAQGEGILERIELAESKPDKSLASYPQSRPLLWSGANPIPGGCSSALDIIYREPETLSSYHYDLAYNDYSRGSIGLPTGMDILMIISITSSNTFPLFTVCYFLGKDSLTLDRFEVLASNLSERPTIYECNQMLIEYKAQSLGNIPLK